jgi:hypothetical protein
MIFLRALYLLSYFRVSLKYRSLSKIFFTIENRPKYSLFAPQSGVQSRRIAQLINAASRYVPYSTCFSKALAGKIIFSENGYFPTLHIGVVKGGGTAFAAHAWLTIADIIVLCNLPDISRYEEMPLGNLEIFR